MPNIVNLIEKYYGNKGNLIAQLRFYMDYIDYMNTKAVKYDKLTAKLESEKPSLKVDKKMFERLTNLTSHTLQPSDTN